MNEALIQVIRSLALVWRQDFVSASAALRASKAPATLDKIAEQQDALFAKVKLALAPYLEKDVAPVKEFVADARSFLAFAEAGKSLVMNSMALRIHTPTADADIVAELHFWATLAEGDGFELGLGKVPSFCRLR